MSVNYITLILTSVTFFTSGIFSNIFFSIANFIVICDNSQCAHSPLNLNFKIPSLKFTNSISPPSIINLGLIFSSSILIFEIVS